MQKVEVGSKAQAVTILVVEDDAAVRTSIAGVLSGSGHRVVLANGPTEAIDRFHSASPDLVIIDIHLPQADSFDTLKQLLELAPDLPVIVLASRASTEDLTRALRLGVSDYLSLPLADDLILEHSVKNSLRRARLLEENSRIRRKLELINAEMEERIEIFRQDQQAGRHVQINMMPVPPQTIGCYHFNHRVFPSLYLSGDTVDYKVVSRHEVLFYIADVSGHGSSSAFITILLRFRIEQMRKEYLRGRFTGAFTPSRILALLNRDLLQAGLEKHITLFMGLLDDVSNTLTYSVAGHQPLPLLFQNGGADFIPLVRSSFPIGLLGEADYFDESVKLSEDFALVLFSDGIFEALKLGDMAAKEARLRELVTECKGDFDSIKKGLGLSKSLSFPDDIAVMSVTRA
jgi:sigma-B regulation protein RsbU (phosphoserine phosphatase)